MLKLPKGLKKKKKGKKSKRKGDDELFTEEELEKYRKEHQQQEATSGEGSVKENEEWSKFKDLTTGVDSVLKKTQGDLDRIKSTSFFQRVAPKQRSPTPPREPPRLAVEITEADFKRPEQEQATTYDDDADEDSDDEDDQDDIFDTSYVEAAERGEVKLGYVSDSPDEALDDDIFDTSHVDAIIRGQDAKTSRGKKGVDIGIAVEVLTGRIDNVTIATTRRSKRVIPGDLFLESTDADSASVRKELAAQVTEPIETSILDIDAEIPVNTPIDLSVSLHTSFIQKNQHTDFNFPSNEESNSFEEHEVDEFTVLATESLEVSSKVIKLEEDEIKAEPVVQKSWSAFEADKNETVFAEGIIEDQIDEIDPYLDQDDPFDTSFADAVVLSVNAQLTKKEAVVLEDDDDFDPRAEEVQVILNNRRKSSVRIHLTNPSGIRESITSDEIIVAQESVTAHDLLSNSTTDLTQLGDSPLDPLNVIDTDIDPFDTSIVDKIVAPGKVELKLLEEELIGATPSIYKVPSDPDFDPRAEESKQDERRASRPENLLVNKSVVFSVNSASDLETKSKPAKPVTPYYTRERSITEDLIEEVEATDIVPNTLNRTRSDEDLTQKHLLQSKRRHSEYPKSSDVLHSSLAGVTAKVLTPSLPVSREVIEEPELDPFDTSFASEIAPSKTELKLLAKEFSCEERYLEADSDFLAPADDLFQVKALSPEPPEVEPGGEVDPFDTSFAGDLNISRAELRLLHGEFLE